VFCSFSLASADRRQHEISAIKLLIFINPALTAKESTARGKLSQSVKLFALVRASRMKFIADFMDLRFYGRKFDETARVRGVEKSLRTLVSLDVIFFSMI
jgi:hypothetical protein